MDHSSFLMVVIAPIAFFLLLLGWLTILARGGQPLVLTVRGFGVNVRISRGQSTTVGGPNDEHN